MKVFVDDMNIYYGLDKVKTAKDKVESQESTQNQFSNNLLNSSSFTFPKEEYSQEEVSSQFLNRQASQQTRNVLEVALQNNQDVDFSQKSVEISSEDKNSKDE